MTFQGGDKMKNLKLLAKMTENDYSQADLAKALNLSKNTVNNKINGKSAFDTREINKICNLLHISDPSEKALIFLN